MNSNTESAGGALTNGVTVPNHLEFRFMVTHDCNYACVFCHEEGIHNGRDKALTPDDYRFLFKTARNTLGWSTASLSGGEPLFRKDITRIAQNLWEEGSKTTLITNGALLAVRSDIGSYLSRVNISIHTMDAVKYEKLIGRRHPLGKTLQAIRVFRDRNPDVDLRFNATIVCGTNAEAQDITNLVKMTKDMNATLKLLELYPPGDPAFVPIKDVEDILIDNGFSPSGSEYRSKKFSNRDLWVMTSKCICSQALDKDNPGEFCRISSDLFLSPDGKVKPCRLDAEEIDLMSAVRTRDEAEIIERISPILTRGNPKCSSLLSSLGVRSQVKPTGVD